MRTTVPNCYPFRNAADAQETDDKNHGVRSDERERRRRRAPVPTTDPTGLAVFAAELRPRVKSLRALAEDATAGPGHRRFDRAYLRKTILRDVRELEARLDAAIAGAAG